MDNSETDCIDPTIGRLVFQWAMLYGRNQEKPDDAELAAHIERCRACGNSVQNWTNQARAARLMAEAERAVRGNLIAHERVDERRNEKGERILFKYSVEDPSAGLLIALAQDGKIAAIRSTTRSSFDEA
jgi:hypothetical protein